MKWKSIRKWTARVLLSLFVLALAALLVGYWTSTNDCDRLTAVPQEAMSAITYCEYGGPEVLRLRSIEKPRPADDQILVRVHAAALNPLDWHFMEGTPRLGRIAMGLRKPKETRLGVDYAGTIEAVGKNVTQFKAGDEVFGGNTGAFGEYLCARADRSVVLKPANITFEEAAALPIAAVTALQALRDKGNLQPGQRVLINGASGGVGTFAVQLAKQFGAHVTAVCSGRNAELVRSLGADAVIDYTKEDFAKGAQRYDLFLDNVPNHSLGDCRGVLTAQGKYIMIGGGSPSDSPWIGPLGRIVEALIYSKFGSHEMRMFLAQLKKDDLKLLGDMMASGKIKAVIDRTYPLSEVPNAMRYLEEGHARGKVIITVP